MRIAVLGTLDTKGHEHAFVAGEVAARGHTPVLIDVGTGGQPQVEPDIPASSIVPEFDEPDDRGRCVAQMATAVPRFVAGLAERGEIDAVISLGGGGGTSIGTAAMRALPIGFPKIMVSTMAGGNVAPYTGIKDIVMFPAVVDVAGLNQVSRTVFAQAAAAVCAMAEASRSQGADATARLPVVASMFGNTTACVDAARAEIEAAGYEVLVFHATGTGGRTLEALVSAGMASGVLDITTTEIADELVGGVLTAGPGRLSAAASVAVPSVVVPGCVDMVNFGPRDSVPARFSHRQFYQHNDEVTLMRTTPDECAAIAHFIADKLNRYPVPPVVLLPLGGVSVISEPDGPFYDPEADRVLFHTLKSELSPRVDVEELDCAINDPRFAAACAGALLGRLPRD